jgi:DNA-binding NarL/FixJ family response regulator
MNLTIGILLTAVFFGVLGVMISLACRKKLKDLRGLVEFGQTQIDELLDANAKSKDMSETNAHRVNEQSRRIAWLETRIRQPKLSSDEVLDDTVLTETPKPTMTERRHRVITLASRGQNAQSIAAALGLLTGEVELIINLNQAALNNK